jgi:hypothetical protein
MVLNPETGFEGLNSLVKGDRQELNNPVDESREGVSPVRK